MNEKDFDVMVTFRVKAQFQHHAEILIHNMIQEGVKKIDQTNEKLNAGWGVRNVPSIVPTRYEETFDFYYWQMSASEAA